MRPSLGPRPELRFGAFVVSAQLWGLPFDSPGSDRDDLVMPGVAAQTLPESDGVRNARVRILGELLDQVDHLATAAVDTMREEIPSYSEQHDERFFDDVLD